MNNLLVFNQLFLYMGKKQKKLIRFFKQMRDYNVLELRTFRPSTDNSRKFISHYIQYFFIPGMRPNTHITPKLRMNVATVRSGIAKNGLITATVKPILAKTILKAS